MVFKKKIFFPCLVLFFLILLVSSFYLKRRPLLAEMSTSPKIIVGFVSSMPEEDLESVESARNGLKISGGGTNSFELKSINIFHSLRETRNAKFLKFIKKEKPNAIVAYVKNASELLDLATTAEEQKVVLINLRYLKNLDQKFEHVFYVNPTPESVGQTLAAFVSKTLRLRKLAILRDTDDVLSVQFTNAFSEGFMATRGKIVSNLSFRGTAAGFGPQFKIIQKISRYKLHK